MGKCQVCGKETKKNYSFCNDCYNKLSTGELIQCENCNTFHNYDIPCPKCGTYSILPENGFNQCIICGERTKGHAFCKKCWKGKEDKELLEILNKKISKNDKQQEIENIEENKTDNIIIDKGFRCITCGYETDGKLFCKKCYEKYQNKEILIKIKNCKEIVPLDDFYEGYFECDDGHVVKSMAEREIDNYLFEQNIKHGYEIPLPLIDEKGKKIILHPDFCIFDEKRNPLFYIEYWGYDDNNRDYTKTKKFKMPLYKKSGITLININAKYDIRNLKTNLKFKLENYKTGISNFENE